MGPTGCPEMSVRNYSSLLCNNLEECNPVMVPVHTLHVTYCTEVMLGF